MIVRVASAVGLAALAAGCGSKSSPPTGRVDREADAKAAKIDPRDFSARVTNPWFPLRPGTTFRYEGSEDGKRAVDIVRVTDRVTRIGGVPCVVVDDRAYLDGRIEEKTTDWYSQDRDGTVWYFGEATRTIDRQGRTKSTEGSWQHGVNGAKAGIFMPLRPRPGQAFRQEYDKGHAEDHFRVVSLTESASVRYGSFRKHAMLTEEWSPLEPGVTEHKYWVRGIGKVREGGLELVSVTRG
jgi:hypothetical protein